MKTIVKFFLKLLAGCLIVLTVAIFGLGAYSMVSFSNSNDLYDLSTSLGQKLSSRVYQFLGKEYTKPEIGANENNDTYTHITENLEEVPTDDLFHSDEIPRITSMKYLQMKSSETGTELATGEKYTSNESFQYQFDKSGKLQRKLDTDGDGNVWTHVYLYDSNDRLSACVSRSYTGNTSLDKYEYDSNGRLILHSSQDSSSSETQKPHGSITMMDKSVRLIGLITKESIVLFSHIRITIQLKKPFMMMRNSLVGESILMMTRASELKL